MKLKIFDRYRPFIHRPGTSFLLPGSTYVFSLYPALIRWHDLQDSGIFGELKLKVSGPVKGFTVQVDLERGFITVWGQALEGYYKYRIHKDGESFVIQKFGEFCIVGEYREGSCIEPSPIQERLFLGVSKKQDWEQVRQRSELKELVPMWYAMAQYYESIPYNAIPSLYEECKIHAAERNRVSIGTSLLSLFKAGFSGVFIPRLCDDDHQGFPLPPLSAQNPLAILGLSRLLLRNLFVHCQKNTVQILPALPVEFHCGKFIQIQMGDLGEVDLEWTKKTIRRLVFRCTKNCELVFEFQNQVKRFRIKRLKEDTNECIDSPQCLSFFSGNTYLFDNFQK